jgi:hypothetical protein
MTDSDALIMLWGLIYFLPLIVAAARGRRVLPWALFNLTCGWQPSLWILGIALAGRKAMDR